MSNEEVQATQKFRENVINQGTSSVMSAAPAPAEITAFECMNIHVRANVDLIAATVMDLRAFLNRAIGDAPAVAPQAETAVVQAGILGSVNEALLEQTRVLGELRECVLVIEKLA